MLAEVLDVLAMFRNVHADIKPANILVNKPPEITEQFPKGRQLREEKLLSL